MAIWNRDSFESLSSINQGCSSNTPLCPETTAVFTKIDSPKRHSKRRYVSLDTLRNNLQLSTKSNSDNINERILNGEYVGYSELEEGVVSNIKISSKKPTTASSISEKTNLNSEIAAKIKKLRNKPTTTSTRREEELKQTIVSLQSMLEAERKLSDDGKYRAVRRKELDELQQKKSLYNALIKKQEKILADAKSYEKTKSEIDSIEILLYDLQRQKTALLDKNTEIDSHTKQLESEAQLLNKEIEHLKEEIEYLKEEIELKKAQLCDDGYLRPKGLLVQLAVAEEKLKIRVSELEKRKTELESEITQPTSPDSSYAEQLTACNAIKNELIVLEAKRKSLTNIIDKQTEKIESLRGIIHDLSAVNTNVTRLEPTQPVDKTVDKQNVVIYCIVFSLLSFAFGLLIA